MVPSRKVIFAGTVEVGDLDFDVATQTELDNHTADTTSVHGITDTSTLVLTSDSRLAMLDGSGFMELSEIGAPAAPAADKFRMFVRDSGGVSQLCIKKPNDSIVVVVPDLWS